MSDRRILGRLLTMMAPNAGWMALAAAVGFLTIAGSVGLMGTAAYIIASAALLPSIAELQVAIVGVRFFGISRGAFRYLERLWSHQATFRHLTRLRVWFYNSLEPLAPARLAQFRSGDLLTRAVADVNTLEQFYLRVIAPPLTALLVAGLMTVFLGGLHPMLAVVVLSGLACAGVVMPLATLWLGHGAGRRSVDVRSRLNTALVDGIQGMPEQLAFNRHREFLATLADLDGRSQRAAQRLAGLAGLQEGLFGLTIHLTTLAILVVAIPLVADGRIGGVSLAVLVLVTIACFEAVYPLPAAWQHLESNLAAARRLFEIVDAQPVVVEPARPLSLPRGHALRIEGLSFRYAVDEPLVLDRLSLALPEGKRVALVGPSGCGKTTLVNLLLRLWDYQEGHVRLGSMAGGPTECTRELRELRAEDVRRLLGVVPQQTHLFNATIRENLSLAQPGAGEADLERVTRLTGVDDFVRNLPDGFDTWIGELGVRLSAGQRQRLAIARTLLRDSPILILDEPTANLDPLVEAQITQDLAQVTAGRTCLWITHRLVGLEAMDEILVMQRGRIVERGRHDELMQARGLYERLWQSQRGC